METNDLNSNLELDKINLSNSIEDTSVELDNLQSSEQSEDATATVATNNINEVKQKRKYVRSGKYSKKNINSDNITSDTININTSEIPDLLEINEFEKNKKEEAEDEEEELFEDTTEDSSSSFFSNISVKDSLLFIDNFVCFALSKFLNKKIDRMSEEDAEFLASLSPPDLQLIKPGKNTFFVAIGAYYLSKIFSA